MSFSRIAGQVVATAVVLGALVDHTPVWAQAPSAPRVDGAKPDAVKPDAVKPDAAKPDAVKPDAVKPDAAKPDAAKPDAAKPDAAKPDAAKPDAVAAKADAAKPDAEPSKGVAAKAPNLQATKVAKPENELLPPEHRHLLAKHPVKLDMSTFKPGTGLWFESRDGAFAIGIRARAQFRYQVDHDPNAPDGEDELTHLFQIRRARVQFKGHVFNKHNKYKLELAFSPRDLGMKDGVPHRTPLLSWYSEFDYLRDFTVRMGQYKIPFSRQRVVSSGDGQLVDRSITQGEFNHDRDIGLDVRSKDLFGLGGYLRYYAGVYMGEGRDFGDKNATPDFALHYLARLEVLPMGTFKDYKEADIERTLSPKLSLGAAYAFHDDSQGLRGVLGGTATDGGTTDYHSATADYAFKWRGFASVGEFHWRRGSRNAGGATLPDPNDATSNILAPVQAARNGYGWFVQAGYLIPRMPLEVAARYSGIRPIGEEDPGDLAAGTNAYTSLGQKDAMGLGLSYYFAGHPWKLAVDYFRIWSDGEILDGENAVRSQLQVAL